MVFHAPGRARFRFSGDDGSEEAFPDVGNYLDIEGVHDASFNRVTGTLLVLYDDDVLPPEDLVRKVRNSTKLVEDEKEEKGAGIEVLRRWRGHLRVRHKSLFKDSSSYWKFVNVLFRHEWVKEVDVNSVTRTALISYDPSKAEENAVILLCKNAAKADETETRDATTTTALLPDLYKKQNGHKKIRFLRYSGVVSACDIIHELPERLRIKHPAIYKRSTTARQVEKTLLKIPGIEICNVKSITSSIVVKYDRTKINRVMIIQAIEEALAVHFTLEPDKPELKGLALATVSLGLTIAGSLYFPWMIPLNIGLILYTAIPTFKRTIASLRKKKVTVDLLDTAIILLCLATMEYAAAAFMVWIVSFADMMLAMTSKSSEDILSQVFGKRVRFARITKDGAEFEKSVDDLKVGDRIVVNTGEQIPIDGRVFFGDGMVDQHALTGESVPAEKGFGDRVFGSTTLLAGRLMIDVECTSQNTTEAKIREIINKSAEYKTKVHRFGEDLANKMVLPTFGLAAIATAISGQNGALAVINCDYGTGIRVAAPTAVLASLSLAAKNGILIKNGKVLETIGRVDTFLFDKTGTLTQEVPEVGDITTHEGFSSGDVLKYAATAEQYLTHPIASAILARAKLEKIEICKMDKSNYKLGFGIEVVADGKKIRVGSLRFMKRENLEVPAGILERVENILGQGKGVVLVAIDDKVAGALELRSSNRLEAQGIVNFLKSRGAEVILVSGDNKAPTKELAGKLGITQFYAEVLPQEKAEIVKTLKSKGRTVAMVGDGINDSVALSVADVSISMRGASDAATDTADVIMMNGNLINLPTIFTISELLQKCIKQSFGMIVVMNSLCIAGALAGFFTLYHSLVFNNLFNFVATVNALKPLYAL